MPSNYPILVILVMQTDLRYLTDKTPAFCVTPFTELGAELLSRKRKFPRSRDDKDIKVRQMTKLYCAQYHMKEGLTVS